MTRPGRWLFDHCAACALNDEGSGPWDAGVGCPSEGPGADGCEAVWLWVPPVQPDAKSALAVSANGATPHGSTRGPQPPETQRARDPQRGHQE